MHHHPDHRTEDWDDAGADPGPDDPDHICERCARGFWGPRNQLWRIGPPREVVMERLCYTCVNELLRSGEAVLAEQPPLDFPPMGPDLPGPAPAGPQVDTPPPSGMVGRTR